MTKHSAIALIFVLTVAGCQNVPIDEGTRSSNNVEVGYKSWRSIPKIYRLQVGDVIDIVHPYNKEFNQQVELLPDGRIYLPLVESVVAADLSPDELKERLEKAYSIELKKPSVAVIPRKIGSQKIYVGGEVLKPGVYSYSGTIGIVEAVFSAGGLRNSANDEEVVVLRRTQDNRAMMTTVDMEAILEGNPGSHDIALRQYDVVYVPKTTSAEIGVWVEQNITNILPFSRSFSYSLNKDLNSK